MRVPSTARKWGYLSTLRILYSFYKTTEKKRTSRCEQRLRGDFFHFAIPCRPNQTDIWVQSVFADTRAANNFENFPQTVRVFLRDSSLSFWIHTPFQDIDNFSKNFLLSEMDRVPNSNEDFDISSTNRLKFLPVLAASLPAMWGKDIVCINNGTFPDQLNFMQQKRSVIRILETDDENCLITALVLGHERSLEAAHGFQKMTINSCSKTKSAAANRLFNQTAAENYQTVLC